MLPHDRIAMLILRWTLCVASIFLPMIANAQEETLQFEYIGLEHGLPQGQVLGLMQDSYGYIWFGTMTGLIRYDGYNFVKYTYSPTDTNSISNSTARPYIEDFRGHIWIGSNSGLNRWDRSTNTFRRFYHHPEDQHSLPHNAVNTVCEDSRNRIWVGTFHGLAWYDGHAFHRIPLSYRFGETDWLEVYSMVEDRDKNLLAGTNCGLLSIDGETLHPTLFPVQPEGATEQIIQVHKVYRDRSDRIWIGTSAGLFRWRAKETAFIQVALRGTPRQQAIRNIIEDGEGKLWLSTLNNNGLFQLDPATGRLRHFRYDPANAYGLASDHVRGLIIDKLNQLWIGTYIGLNKIDLNPPRFQLLQQEPGVGRPENLIYKAYHDRWGGLWFSTYQHQGFYARRAGEKAVATDFLPISILPTQLENFCSVGDGEVWISTWPKAVIRYDTKTGISQKMSGLTDRADEPGTESHLYMKEDWTDPQYVWISSKNGLCRVDKESLEKTYFPPDRDIPSLQNNWIWNGSQSPDGYIYVLFESHFNGRLGRFDKREQSYELIEPGHELPSGKSTIHVRQFAYTPDTTLWMATADGLGRLPPGTGHLQLLTTADGLIEDNLLGIAADHRGNVWLKGMQHLSRYQPATDSFWHFPVGKDMREFNSVGATVAPDGRMFFYGNNGFYAFYPDSVLLDTTLPRIVLTDLRVLNQSRYFGTAPELIRDIELGYRDNVLSFEYAGLHFRDPRNNRYRYRLEGFDEDWIEAGTERKVTYTNLKPGKYIFQVMTSNADGVWNPEPLRVSIRLLPPPWRTWWAYCGYVLIIGFALWVIYAFQRQRWLLRAQLAIEHQEAERLKELDTLKNRLIANITHEFRTPLTIILGVARQLRQTSQSWLRDGLDMLIRNAEQLLKLVNQMLDLSRLESGNTPMQMVQGDIIPYLRYLLGSFRSLAESKNIELHFATDREPLEMDYDAEKLRKIVSNLLSNAIKFTMEGGTVLMRLAVQEPEPPVSETRTSSPASGDLLVLTVEDSGVGIAAEDLPKIFDRFYQVDSSSTRKTAGTGIGLALVKELVQLLGGSIDVRSALGGGTTFELRLPITNEAPAVYPAPQPAASSTSETGAQITFGDLASVKKEAAQLLIVEDNQDLIDYLGSFLASQYCIHSARNGREGVEKAVDLIPDLIISDVMMPEMNGFELCRHLKMDIRTSHIPIVLLTARADASSKITGLRQGADAYLGKPFDKEELLVRLSKLLELRRRLRERYASHGLPAAGPETIEFQLEDDFMCRVREVMQAHLGDAGFSIPDLSQELGLSRPQLYRKFNALTDQSVGQYFRNMRLQRAKKLLQSTSLSISEIAYEVGFKHHSHFANTFRELFGVSPTEMRNS